MEEVCGDSSAVCLHFSKLIGIYLQEFAHFSIFVQNYGAQTGIAAHA
jgi:hypothetical protein